MTRAAPRLPSPARGMALLLVLWACALMTIVLGSFAILASTEGLQTRYQTAHIEARYAAQAGLARAIAELDDANPTQRWQADGRAYTFGFQRATITVRITDEDGKIDINTVQPEIMQRLLVLLGQDPARARALSEAIVDWRDSDDLQQPDGAERSRYQQAGRDYGPRNGPFASVQELQQVLGMTPNLYARLAPLLTIWSGHMQPNPMHASALVLAAIPGMSEHSAERYVDARHQLDLSSGRLPTLPPGLVTRGGNDSTTFSITSDATLSDGTRAQLRATIRRRGSRPNGLPYVILHWHQGPSDT